MSLGGGNGGPAFAFPGGGGSEAGSAQPPPPEEFQPNAGPPVTVPAPQQGTNSIEKILA